MNFVNSPNLFKGRTLVIATKHCKEQVAKPLFEAAWGVVCTTSAIDTDVLGTFTGEIKRELPPLQAALQKCHMAIQQSGCTLAVASEGSFFSHPQIPFVAVNEEIVVLVDKENKLQISECCLSFDTNFCQAFIKSWDEMQDFANKVQFPSHAIILRVNPDSALNITKGITTWKALKTTFEELHLQYKKVYAETDMRAMHNPTRMLVIKTAVEKLIARVNSLCPVCSFPGFGTTSFKEGLPCELCGLPTQSILSFIQSCTHCGFQKELLYPKNKKYEKAQFCQHCNP